jgi:biotin carboxyl carrier protein
VARSFEIEVGGRNRHVTVDRVNDRYRVEYDGRVEWVDVAPVDERTWSLLVGDRDRRQSHEVGVLEGREPGQVEVYLKTGVIPVRLGGPSATRRAAAAASAAAGGPARLTSPMPGKVVKVLVAPGDRVTARQGLVVVEAMKMQNALKAPRDGVVTEVPVREGMTVEAGRVVAVVE